MKRIAVFVVVALALFGTPVLAGDKVKGEANIEQVVASINGTNVDAEIRFIDTGTSLTVRGKAEGLVRGQQYFSLLYDVGSPVTGPGACEPTRGPGQPGFLTIDQMIVGFWTPPTGDDEDWTINVTKTGASYVPLSQVGTMSVRIVLGPPPAGFKLQGCGKVETEADD